jgi:hypothetical protein
MGAGPSRPAAPRGAGARAHAAPPATPPRSARRSLGCRHAAARRRGPRRPPPLHSAAPRRAAPAAPPRPCGGPPARDPSGPPCGPAARSRVPTRPTAAFCRAVRGARSPLRPNPGVRLRGVGAGAAGWPGGAPRVPPDRRLGRPADRPASDPARARRDRRLAPAHPRAEGGLRGRLPPRPRGSHPASPVPGRRPASLGGGVLPTPPHENARAAASPAAPLTPGTGTCTP